MVPVHVITALAQTETAKETILKQLREAGATSAAMPGSVALDGDDAQSALAELVAAGTVQEARTGLYYVDESAKKATMPGNGFVALLAILVLASITASVVALAAAG